MKRRLRFWLLCPALFLLACAGSPLCAQAPQTLEVGPHGGITTYLGDINTWKMFDQFDYEFGGVVRYNYDPRWSFRLDYTYEVIKGQDAVIGWRPERDLSFKTKIHDLSVITEFNFLEYYTGRPSTSISPYLFGGLSVLMFDPQPFTGDMSLDTLHLNLMATEGVQYSRFTLSMPFGFGCKFSLSPHLGTTIEWRMHWTMTDYLDDIHGVYPDQHVTLYDDQGTLLYDFTDPSGRFHEGQQRGNSQSNDWFGSLNVSLTWKFEIPKKTHCNLDF